MAVPVAVKQVDTRRERIAGCGADHAWSFNRCKNLSDDRSSLRRATGTRFFQIARSGGTENFPETSR